MEKHYQFNYTVIKESELTSVQSVLFHKAKSAARLAYAPYSNFWVGAALLLENGEIYAANNQENAAYPSGICAERSLLNWVKANFPDIPIKAMLVLGHSKGDFQNIPLSPCCACRQVMLEVATRQKDPIELIMPAGKGAFIVLSTWLHLVPFPFDSDALK